jgi:succinate-acetate transporter protein
MEAGATPNAPGPAARPAEPAGGWTPADPGPLGLAAFALTTFVLSMYNAGLVAEPGEPIVYGLAFAYGGLAQILAGMWEFRTGNTFGAVAFTSYGAFWLSFWAWREFDRPTVREEGAAADVLNAASVYLFAWGIFTLYMLVATLRINGMLVIVFTLLTITFFLLAIGDSGGDRNMDIHKAGGYFGLATAVAAWYGSFAGVANSTFGRVILPVFPLRR